ncbi:MAG: hypothetical protein KJO64_10440, partial [Bacteroidia bacterium]|nr:hypothetical protein [Bacteroidia bacterium]
IRTFAQGTKTETHILDPRFWNAFKDFEVNEFEFIDCWYFEARKVDKTKEGAEALIGSNYETILSQPNPNRFLTGYISSVRAIEGGVMKVKYYKREKPVSKKMTGLEALTNQIKFLLKKKIELAEEYDLRYGE